MKKIFFRIVLGLIPLGLVFSQNTRLNHLLSYFSLYKNTLTTIQQIYDKMPQVSKGDPGVLKKDDRDLALQMINAIRALHDLPRVEYNESDDVYTTQSSLIMAANKKMTHYPAKNSRFYSEEGAIGSRTGNLYFGGMYSDGRIFSTEYFVSGWVIDKGVESLGHRRWVLHPFLKHISYGRVDGNNVSAATLKVINDANQDLTNTDLKFVAYPYKDYPNLLFDKEWYLSFTVVAGLKSPWDSGQEKVAYRAAKIEVTDDRKQKYVVYAVKTDYQGYGMPNIIQWKVKGLQEDTVYHVKISGVFVNGQLTSYSYPFRIVSKEKAKALHY